MKNNWALRLAGIALVLTLVTSSLVSGTYAKYVTAVTGTDTARVAKFAVTLEENGVAVTDNITFNIFDTTTDTGVKGADLIAPGTTGSFELDVDIKSEVAYSRTFVLQESKNNGIPIYYTYDGQRYSSVLTGGYGEGSDVYKDISALATAISGLSGTDGTFADYSETLTLSWAWDFDSAGTGQTNPIDTDLGLLAANANGVDTFVPEVELTFNLTVAQLDVAP